MAADPSVTRALPALLLAAVALAGCGDQGPTHTMAEVARHHDASSCWTVVDGQVHDVTPWVTQHPGGRQRILALCGTDASQSFANKHTGSSAAKDQLRTMRIGRLAG